MSLYATCPCGIPEGLDMTHLRTDCPHYGSTPETPPAPTVTGEELAHINEMERQQIADGAYGDGPFMRGLARDASPNAPQAEAVVTEADRRAAAAFVRHAWHLFWPNNYVQAMQDAKDMEAGRCDNWFLVQSFARHRLSALSQHQSEVEALRDKEEDEAYEIGKRDGYSEALADVDRRTGGDGEYCFSTIPDRGCPDEESMMLKIVDRVEGAEARATKAEAENARLREAQERFLGTIQDRMSRISESDAKHADALIDELVRVAGYFRQAKDAQG